MSNSSSRDSQARKRNLPSWMSDRPEAETAPAATSAASISDPKKQFSKLMKGVVFALSGFVNPERGTLRSQAIEMGAEYQPDWNSGCTLLVCAFQNTPKFRQVEADSGTIVSKEWISECYNQRKLVDIEPYLMNAGKPWRRQTGSAQANQAFADSPSPSGKAQTQVEKSSHSKPGKGQVEKSSHSKPGKAEVEKSSHPQTSSPLSKGVPANHTSDSFSPSRVKQWASDDFRRTITWLEDQDEKPEESEMKKIAVEGIVTCLQDTIDALKEGQNVKQITEEWGCIPKAVEELIKLNETRGDAVSVRKQAMEFKRIYEAEYSKMEDDSSATKKPKTTGKGKQLHNEDKTTVSGDKTAYDSDETIEMTEDEIDQAFNVVSSKLVDSSR